MSMSGHDLSHPSLSEFTIRRKNLLLYTRELRVSMPSSINRIRFSTHEAHPARLDCGRRLFPDQSAHWPLLPQKGQRQHERFLCVGPRSLMVAGWHIDGGHYVRRGYTTVGD